MHDPERIRKLDQHNGFVKGVCFDPVGEFMATQSDDKSVKIWRTTDWEVEAEIREPFEDSPGSTFFRRLRCVYWSHSISQHSPYGTVGPQMVPILLRPTLPITGASFSLPLSSRDVCGPLKSVSWAMKIR